MKTICQFKVTAYITKRYKEEHKIPEPLSGDILGQGRRRREEKWAILTLGFYWVFQKYQNDTIWHIDRIKKRVGNLGLGQKNTSR